MTVNLLLKFVTIFVETHLNPARAIIVTTITVKRSLITVRRWTGLMSLQPLILRRKPMAWLD